jgi:hypothetical protein
MENYIQLSGEYYLPKNYSYILPPNDGYEGKPILVDMEINNFDVIEVNDHDFTVTSKMHIGLHWKDERIFHTGLNGTHSQKHLDLKSLDYLWTPDFDIYSLKKLEIFEVMGKELAGNE